MDPGSRAAAPDVPVVPLADEERAYYSWLARELLNAASITPNKRTRDLVLAELDELVHELLGRCP